MIKKLLLAFLFLLSSNLLFSQVPAGDTYMQGFYWNSLPGGVWWDSLYKLSASLKSAGFSAIWIPSANKGAGGGYSMGYDIYDHYDFGEFPQKGSIETRFGSRAELERMISQFQKLGMDIYYDAVLNHTAGGELKGINSCRTDSAYLVYNYLNGSRRFQKNANSFNPSSNNNCNQSPPYNNNAFTFAEDNCTDCPDVRDSLIAWGNYLKNTLKISGVRLDAVKHINPGFLANWVNQAFQNKYVVGEFWGSADEIKNYYDALAFSGGGSVSMFDFPLRYTIESMCNNGFGTFDMRGLDWAGLIRGKGMSGYNVSTFIENHDVDRTGWNGVVDTAVNGHQPVFRDKHLGYAFIMFSEGRPCVFFRDYFNYGLKSIIDTLIFIRHKFLGGNTTYRDGLNPWYIREDNNQDQNLNAQDIFVARRNGYQNQIGGYIVINDNPDKWIDVWVDTEAPIGSVYKDYSGRDVNKVVVGPIGSGKNRVKLWAPKRNFTIYVLDTTAIINQAPVIIKIDRLITHTFQNLNYQFIASDGNNDSLSYSIQNNPTWLSLNPNGFLSGIPTTSDTGSFDNIIITVTDKFGANDKDTFSVKVFYNGFPVLSNMSDTTTFATYRFERVCNAIDDPQDTLHYYLLQKPDWLNIDEFSGIIAGTPNIADTITSNIIVEVSDNKGGKDTTSFNLTVKSKKDTIIYTYAKPRIDGSVSISNEDWRPEWLRIADPHDDSRWTAFNELYDLLLTWDADSIYIGVTYDIKINTFMMYLDLNLDNGETNFNSNYGYLGSFNRNFRFKQEDNIDLMIASWNKEIPRVYTIVDSNSIEISDLCNRVGTTDHEIAIAWNTIYNLGPGLIKPNAKIKLVSVIAGGENWGGGDAAPSQCDIELCPAGLDSIYQGPDSLLILDTVFVDKNGDGIPDPTIIISKIDQEHHYYSNYPNNYYLLNNYPNPFNPTTTITYEIPAPNNTNFIKLNVVLKIYDVLGREIETLVSKEQTAGKYSVEWNASKYSSGVYYYELSVGEFRSIKKMILMK